MELQETGLTCVLGDYDKNRKVTVGTHKAVALLLFLLQDVNVAPLCHLYGCSCVPVSGGTRDGHDGRGPGLVQVV